MEIPKALNTIPNRVGPLDKIIVTTLSERLWGDLFNSQLAEVRAK